MRREAEVLEQFTDNRLEMFVRHEFRRERLIGDLGAVSAVQVLIRGAVESTYNAH
jgi:hypothetical protein